MQSPNYVMPCIQFASYDEQESGVTNTNDVYVPSRGSEGRGYYDPCLIIHNVNQSGAYFTGLSPETTFQLTSVFYYEDAPGLASGIALQTAYDKTGNDQKVLDFYLNIEKHLPVGCKQTMNDDGDWISLIGDIAGVVPVIGNYLGMGIKALGYGYRGGKLAYDFYKANQTQTPANNRVPSEKVVRQREEALAPRLMPRPAPRIEKSSTPKPKPLPPLPVKRDLPLRGSKKFIKYSKKTNADLKNMGFTNAQIKVLHHTG